MRKKRRDELMWRTHVTGELHYALTKALLKDIVDTRMEVAFLRGAIQKIDESMLPGDAPFGYSL
jgi:hypothetical protein